MSFSLSCSSWILVTESALLPLIQKEHFLNTQHSFCHSPQLSWGFSSVIKFDPKWDGSLSDSSDVKLSDETAIMPGLCFTVGGKTASFSASIDYIDASFDVTTYNEWVANDDSLDMSGFAIQLGVLFSF